jgi:predicted component of type VI protein secretion system
MALLNKFVTSPSPRSPLKRDTATSDEHLASIIQNLQSILQARQSIDLTQKAGLQDFCELSVSDVLINQLCQDIQQQINRHEKRLQQVEVVLAESSEVCWQLAVTANLSQSRTEQHTFQHLADAQVQFTLEVAKRSYRESKKAMNGVYL